MLFQFRNVSTHENDRLVHQLKCVSMMALQHSSLYKNSLLKHFSNFQEKFLEAFCNWLSNKIILFQHCFPISAIEIHVCPMKYTLPKVNHIHLQAILVHTMRVLLHECNSKSFRLNRFH